MRRLIFILLGCLALPACAGIEKAATSDPLKDACVLKRVDTPAEAPKPCASLAG
jgi:hypothetical protein